MKQRRKKRVLLAVTGLSPQVVTETLFALAVQRTPAWIPHEIRLVTTAEGADRARLTLLDRKTGFFHKLRRDYRLPEIDFGGQSILVVRDSQGKPLQDIRTAEDNAAAADFLLQQILAVTQDPSTELHVSIAGGRKTMGFFAGYALSLCGRPQDALSHVLVDPPFESHPGFFYPTRRPQVIHSPPPESRPLDTSRARITLAEIPFVRLRQYVEFSGSAGRGFAETVQAVQLEVTPSVEFQPHLGLVRAGATSVKFPPVELAFYSMMAAAQKKGRRIFCPPGSEDPALAELFLAQYRKYAGQRDIERTAKALRRGMSREYFLERVSRINALLARTLGPVRAAAYQIHAAGRRPQTEYFLRLGAASIRFQEDEK
jgi:CRISPR-associated protein (TIGR02584 family)